MKCFISIDVPEGELERILEDLRNAQETIRQCYHRLETLGVLRITEEATSES